MNLTEAEDTKKKEEVARIYRRTIQKRSSFQSPIMKRSCWQCPGLSNRAVGQWWLTAGLGAKSVSVHAYDLRKEVAIIFISSTIIWPQVNSREGTQPHPTTENWIKDILSMAPPIRTRPSFPLWKKERKKVNSLICAQLFATPWTVASTELLRAWDFLAKSTGVGCHFLLQGIFLTQGSNPGLLHCRQMLYHLSHQGSLCSPR